MNKNKMAKSIETIIKNETNISIKIKALFNQFAVYTDNSSFIVNIPINLNSLSVKTNKNGNYVLQILGNYLQDADTITLQHLFVNEEKIKKMLIDIVKLNLSKIINR